MCTRQYHMTINSRVHIRTPTVNHRSPQSRNKQTKVFPSSLGGGEASDLPYLDLYHRLYFPSRWFRLACSRGLRLNISKQQSTRATIPTSPRYPMISRRRRRQLYNFQISYVVEERWRKHGQFLILTVTLDNI